MKNVASVGRAKRAVNGTNINLKGLRNQMERTCRRIIDTEAMHSVGV